MIFLLLISVAIYLLLFTNKETFEKETISNENLERIKMALLEKERQKFLKIEAEKTKSFETLSKKEFNAATNSLFFNLKNDIDKANVIKVLIGMVKQKSLSVGKNNKTKKMSESQLVRLTQEIKNNT